MAVDFRVLEIEARRHGLASYDYPEAISVSVSTWAESEAEAPSVAAVVDVVRWLDIEQPGTRALRRRWLPS
jgi:hypothetical protein